MNKFTDKQLSDNYNYLELLSEKFPCIGVAASEVINLKAIMNLPKGTEHFLTDIHGEHDAFSHVMRNASGVVKRKISDVFSKTLSQHEIDELATLIYYPEEKLKLVKSNEENILDWYKTKIYQLIQICRGASSKYTRSKVRKSLPSFFSYIMEELLHEDEDRFNKKEYYNKIIDTIVELNQADQFITEISSVIQRLTIDHLHIIGDIYDRGPGSHIVMDTLMQHHSLDIQWGNHDILWMGAAAGDLSCIANVIRVCLRYSNMSILEDGYGINLLPLATFAIETYEQDPCKQFIPKANISEFFSEFDIQLLSKMHKAISIIQFKLEHQLINSHPEYNMEHRQVLDKIDYDHSTINVNNISYELHKEQLTTINPDKPWELTPEEEIVIQKLQSSFLMSERLQKHVRFLFSKGSIYLTYNGNLLFHASIPMNYDGSFKKVRIMNDYLSGKDLLDKLDQYAREAYFENPINSIGTEIFWYLWCHHNSPLFGKDKMATFERYFVIDPILHNEQYTPYYTLICDEKIAKKILLEFNLDPDEGHIINGHVPVKTIHGESPIKANGRLLVIDGGFARAYQSTTGIAGYTLIYNSFGLQLASHEPFHSVEKAINNGIDIHSTTSVIEKTVDRKRVADTDVGKKINTQIYYLEMLIAAYRKGILKEKL
ncbi:fructose-bisphosphatase class III [Alkalibaculum sp. M08DMB]|uniref:Fructose-1,6-bisphosphatase class 3 n=1 Tax=Alkalibaculum sporogenes TaxID=2655001 RepID=A0A6A7K6K9_9FIRM|nr:fructose-1,6-bisphosphatase [Alkalibaculum sporogenes]MPW25066.1 fructose-bisphosphatase class III [Alkalibaculum sporogenes]